jgi:tyrosinase
MKIRKNQKHLTAGEWDNFICAFKNLKEGLLKGVDKPTMDDFADEHAAAFKEKNHDWQVHTHGAEKGHWALLFLPWHRVMLNEFENRLRREVAGVTIPFWNAFKDPFPEALKKISDNEGERVDFPSDQLTDLLPDFGESDFETFQHDLEVGYHNRVHAVLGGTFGGRHSPRDAAFWLHHAFVDRQWGHWYEKQNGTLPSDMDKPIPGEQIVEGKRVRDVLHTSQLGYVYGNGIYNTIEKEGSETGSYVLEQGMILCARLDEDFYVKMLVKSLSFETAVISTQLFAYLKPGIKPGAKRDIVVADTMYYELNTGRANADQAQAHIRLIRKAAGEQYTYVLQGVNGTRLALFNSITDFTANKGQGAVDFQMLTL